MVGAGWIHDAGNLAAPTFKTPAPGVATRVWAAISPQLMGVGGVYCEDRDMARPALDGGPALVGVRAYAPAPVGAARPWRLAAGLTGIDALTSNV